MLYAYVTALLLASKEIYYISSQNYFKECILMFSGVEKGCIGNQWVNKKHLWQLSVLFTRKWNSSFFSVH